MHSIWETHKMEEEWGFLLIDARNAFNMRLIARRCCGWYAMNGRQEQHHALLVNHEAIRKSVVIFKPRRSNERRSSFYNLLRDRNPPAYSQAQEWISRCKIAMVCRWWINCRKVCRNLCPVCATFATWSQLRILPRIVEEHPSCCIPQCRTSKIEFAGLSFEAELVHAVSTIS